MPADTPPATCATCIYGEFIIGDKGNCRFPIPPWLARIVRRSHKAQTDNEYFPGDYNEIEKTDGARCPCHSPKEAPDATRA